MFIDENTNRSSPLQLRGYNPSTRAGAIMRFLKEHPRGATADEIAMRLQLVAGQVSPRLSDLAKKNIVRKTDEYRMSRLGVRSVVWKYEPDNS